MSNSLAITAVTKTLQNMLLNRYLADYSAAEVTSIKTEFVDIESYEVTTKPPDKARPTTGNTKNQVNLFMYQTTHNPALRNFDMPGQVKKGETGHTPAALDLHYLITTYGKDDDELQAQVVMGQVVRILNDQPLLARSDIQAALVENDLHLQIERVRLTPQALSIEELSKLWSAFQTQYRLSVVYIASVVLIESEEPARTPLPVLTRGEDDQGVMVVGSLVPPYPELESVAWPDLKASAELGDTLTLTGHHLEGDSVDVRFTHALLDDPIVLAGTPQPGGKQVTVDIPSAGSAPRDWPAGIYRLSVEVTHGTDVRETNQKAFPLAPHIESLSPSNPPAGNIDFTVTCKPQIRLDQKAALLLSSQELKPEDFALPPGASNPSTLIFKAANVDAGTYYVRLRVDGVDSLLIAYTGTPPTPEFDANYKVTVT
jgi:hypothetical protein